MTKREEHRHLTLPGGYLIPASAVDVRPDHGISRDRSRGRGRRRRTGSAGDGLGRKSVSHGVAEADDMAKLVVPILAQRVDGWVL